MSILRFDDKELLARLRVLPNRLRVVFAAACAERQFPNYLGFSITTREGNPDVLARALGCLWDDVEGRAALDSQLRRHLDACMPLLPDDEDRTNYGIVYRAEDAVAATAYAISARLGADPQQAVWASRRACEAVDDYVQEILGIESFGRDELERVAAHPLVQAEFRRQRADLSQLEQLAKHPSGEKAGIASLRHRAQLDARVFFGSGAV